MSESTRLLTSQELSNEDRRLLGTAENYLEFNDDYFCCQKFDLTKNLSYFRKQTIDVFLAKICTLGEDRWSREKIVPFKDFETFPNKPLGNIWTDYEFDVPQTTQMESELSLSKSLHETRQKRNCSTTHSTNNENQCVDCGNTSFVTAWHEVYARWLNEVSTMIYFSYEPCFVPQEMIRKSKDFNVRFRYDAVWSPDEKSLDSILNNCENLSEEFRLKLNQKFINNHLQKAKPIRRILVEILHSPIVQCQYQLRNIPGSSFSFLVRSDFLIVSFRKSFYVLYLWNEESFIRYRRIISIGVPTNGLAMSTLLISFVIEDFLKFHR